jgi:peroxiredoxin Q/BCP
MLQEGSRAPDFTLSADDGSQFVLSKVKGKNIVLYFYSKDNTSG